MSKFISGLLLIVTLLSLTACGNSSDTQVNSTSEPSAASEITITPEENSSSGSESAPASASEIENGTDEQEESDTRSIDANQPVEGSVVPTEADNSEASNTQGGKVLIAYFSRVGNTVCDPNVDAVTSATLNLRNGTLTGNNKIIAEMAVNLTGGDLFPLQTVKAYPSDYRETTDVAKEEQNANVRPELSTHMENMNDYDTIVLIYPNWWGTIPNALCTFLEEYDFSGKTIAPVCTHEGSGLGSSVSDIKELCPDATIADGLAIRGSSVTGAQEQVENWLNGLDILN